MGITRGFGVDIGGSGVKGGLVDLEAGALDGERLRIPTPQPSTPEAVAEVVAEIVEKFQWDGPVGVTLPCVVKHGVALSAANVDKGWIDCDAQHLFAERLKRKPEDIVGPALFLASDLSAYVSGTIVMADGGYRAI